MSDQTIEQKLEDLRQVILDINQSMVTAFKAVDNNFDGIIKRLDAIDSKIKTLATQDGLGDVGTKLEELKVEVIKIQKISGYSEQFENLLKISKR